MCEFPDLWRNTYTHHDLDKETTWKGKVLSLNLHINHSYFNIYFIITAVLFWAPSTTWSLYYEHTTYIIIT